MDLFEMIDAVAETVGRPLSPAALAVMGRALEGHPLPLVMQALDRCARECRHRLTLADVLDRIPGNHPGAEEAWAIARDARDESKTLVWTAPMAEAWAVASGMDDVSGRMAFKDAYQRLVAEQPGMPRWQVSLGFDREGRWLAVRGAVQVGRLPSGECARLGLLAPGEADSLRALPAPVADEPMSAGDVAAAGLAAVRLLRGGE